MYRKILLFTSICSILSFFAVVMVAGLFYHTYWYHLKRGLTLNDRQLVELIQSGLHTQLKQTDLHANFLLLGTDELANREGDPVLTDTIILVSFDLLSAKIKAISLPRDLWSVEYKTKINALYQFGKERDAAHPEAFPTKVISEMSGLPIHYTLVVSLDDLKTLVDLLSGVRVNVKKGFIDEQFPRTDVDIRTEHNPKKLYQTIKFEAGVQEMTGEQVLQYIRSRKSSDLESGTDDARTQRQQEIIVALIEKLKQRAILSNPSLIGDIAKWYRERFDQYFSLKEAIAFSQVFGFVPTELYFQPEQLSIETNESPGVIFHPSVLKYNVWVYEIKNLEDFRKELFTKLGLPYNKTE